MGLSEGLRARHEDAWERIHSHPFIRGIGDGTLPVVRFRYYLEQDYLFLVEYGRVLALAVAKAPDLATMARLAQLLGATLTEEMDLHRRYSSGFGASAESLEGVVAAPATSHYTTHLLAVAYSGSLAEILFALLPCAWGYHEIALRLLGSGGDREENPYSEWIRTYASPEYGELAEWLRHLADRLAEGWPERETALLERRYVEGLSHELAFWEMAYSGGHS